MKDYIGTAVIILLYCVTFSQAQNWTPDPFCPFPSDHVTRYPYYGNCSVYWECYAGTKYVMECPEGLEFNAPLQECDTPSIANCDPFASTTANPNPPTYTTISTSSHQPGPDCPFPSDEEIFYPYDGDCTKYWECYEGNAYLYNCPKGLWWHQELSQCDYPGDFCTNTTSTSGTGTTPTSTSHSTLTTPHGKPDCEGVGEDPVYYPYPGDCTKYWECANSELFEESCPEGLWWNPTVNQCDYPGSYCSDSSLPTGNTDSSTQTTPGNLPDCFGTGADPVYYPYEGDCTKYWECANSERYLYSCPEGLWWHQEASECDYPGDFCKWG